MRKNAKENTINAMVQLFADREEQGLEPLPTQVAVADELLMSQGTVSRLMPWAIIRYHELYPHGGLQMTRSEGYRASEEQSPAEVRMTRGQVRAGVTKFRRSIAQMDVANAGPGAKAAQTMLRAALGLVDQALVLLDEVVDEVDA